MHGGVHAVVKASADHQPAVERFVRADVVAPIADCDCVLRTGRL